MWFLGVILQWTVERNSLLIMVHYLKNFSIESYIKSIPYSYFLFSKFKSSCSDPQPHPPDFFKHMEIFEPETINNINIVFSSYLQKKYRFIFFTMDDILVWKVTLFVILKKVDFPKISEQTFNPTFIIWSKIIWYNLHF